MDIEFCSQHLLAFDNSLITENDIKTKAEENLSKIINKINELNYEINDENEKIYLLQNKTNIFNIPRYSKLLENKKKTKWQEFSEIVLKKKKNKSGLIYDKHNKGWLRRYKKKEMKMNENKNDFVHEFKDNENIYEDPFKKKEEDKKIRKLKQNVRELKNKFLQKGVTDEDINYIQRQKKKKLGLVDNLKIAQISSSTFGRIDKKFKKEKKIKTKKDILKQKPEKCSLKDEINKNNKLASIILKS